MSSIREVKRLMGSGYPRVKTMLTGKDWCIVGFGEKTIVLRIERENIEFDRQKGTIRTKVSLDSIR